MQIKTNHIVVKYAALLAAATWFIDAAVDSMIFKRGSFVDELYYDLNAHEAYFRLLVITVILVFGFVMEHLLSKARTAENALRRQAAAIESSMDGVAIFNSNDEYVYVNEAYARLGGYDSPADIIGKTYRIMYDEQERARMDQVCVPNLKKGSKWRGELVATRKNGSTYFQEASVTMLEDGGRVCIVRDITWRKRSEDRLKRSERFLNTTFDSIRDPFCIFDSEFRIIKMNDAYAQLKGRHSSELIGKKCHEVLYNMPAVCKECVVEKTFQSADPCAKDKHVTAPDGGELWEEIYTYPILDEAGTVSHVMEYTRDITDRRKSEAERKRLIDKLEHLSRTDGLTGLMNRRALTDSLAYEVDRAKRYGAELAVILCDIDNFKDINDTFGHDAGDRALQAISSTLKALLRKPDIAGRYGGDEFLLLLPETSLEEAESVAGKLLNAVRGADVKTEDGRTISASMSIGVAAFKPHIDDADSFVKRADEAMYASKQGGRNRVSSG